MASRGSGDVTNTGASPVPDTQPFIDSDDEVDMSSALHDGAHAGAGTGSGSGSNTGSDSGSDTGSDSDSDSDSDADAGTETGATSDASTVPTEDQRDIIRQASVDSTLSVVTLCANCESPDRLAKPLGCAQGCVFCDSCLLAACKEDPTCPRCTLPPRLCIHAQWGKDATACADAEAKRVASDDMVNVTLSTGMTRGFAQQRLGKHHTWRVKSLQDVRCFTCGARTGEEVVCGGLHLSKALAAGSTYVSVEGHCLRGFCRACLVCVDETALDEEDEFQCRYCRRADVVQGVFGRARGGATLKITGAAHGMPRAPRRSTTTKKRRKK